MSKVRIISTIKNMTSLEEIKFTSYGLMKENKLVYKTDDIQEMIIKPNQIFLKKKRSDGVEMEFTFEENKKSEITVKMNGSLLKIPLFTKRLMIKKGKIEIDYEIDESSFSFILEYEM